MIETVKRPYEFLARWREGELTGAHICFELTATEDGKVLSTTPLDAMPVDIGQGIGFPLADILGQLQIDAIEKMNTANAECKIAKDACAKHESKIAALALKIAELEKVIASH